MFVIAAVAANPKGLDLAWSFLQEKWSTLVETYNGGFLLNRVVSAVVSGFISSEKEQEAREFFDARPCPAIKRALEQSLEKIQINRAWLERDGDAVVQWLQ